MAQYSVFEIADEILKIAKREGRALTPLQLMKLVYIAHGWSLAIRNVDLFSNRIEAWKYGPVVPDLYQATKSYGRAPIPLARIDASTSAIDENTASFLRDVFKKYGHLSGFALSELTHKPGTPWEQIYEDDAYGLEIPDALIKDHYLRLLHERGSPAAR